MKSVSGMDIPFMLRFWHGYESRFWAVTGGGKNARGMRVSRECGKANIKASLFLGFFGDKRFVFMGVAGILKWVRL